MTPVRTALPADAGAIARVRVASWRKAYRGIVPDGVLDALDATVTPRLRDQLTAPKTGQSLLVCESEGAVCGFVNCGPYRIDQVPSRIDADSGAEIYAIYVDPQMWGKSCGTALVNAAEQLLTQASFTRCRLWTLAANKRARRFYSSRGYVPDGGRLDYTAADGTRVPQVRFRKELRG